MTGRVPYSLGVILITSWLTACSMMGWKSDPPSDASTPGTVAPMSEASDAGQLLIELARLYPLPKPELRQALADTEQRYRDWGDVVSRIELAWLLSRPGSGFQDDRRAALLLREYLDLDGTDPGYRAIADLIHVSVLERGEERSAASRAEADLTEARAQNDVLEEQIMTLQDLLQTLQQQFEALKDIETDISERPSPEQELRPDDG
jgi:hypothetical protein